MPPAVVPPGCWVPATPPDAVAKVVGILRLPLPTKAGEPVAAAPPIVNPLLVNVAVAAFEKLPEGTVGTLVKPENKATLTTILTYHVVAGKLTAKDVMAAIKAGGGKATLTTVAGAKITARLSGNSIVITDGKGGQSAVTTADVMQSNGVVHVIDSVLLP